MAINLILNLIKGAKPTGPGRWIALCPAHEDRSPSLALEAGSDGRVLMHCFAGCDTAAVMAAIGLELKDLYPKPLYHRARHLPYRISAEDALACLTREATVVAMAVSNLVDGMPVTDADADRVAKAAGRIAEAMGVVHGH